ncbi:MAG: RNA ligase family protein [bacterium]|nr:RNA ligase family protein [bacterium]
MRELRKYPRTLHIEGSRSQPGDEDLQSVPLASIAQGHVVVEEKLDGANAGVSFDTEGNLLLQSRGHYLTGGARERHFDLFKTWASAHRTALHEALGERYVMYGEWLFAKHTIFYDALPHYFMEFDVLDTESGAFLATPERRELLGDAPVRSVPVLSEGAVRDVDALRALVRHSLYKTSTWGERLSEHALREGRPVERTLEETDPSPLAEGLYLKVEGNGRVIGRYKFIRKSFLTAVTDAESHWLARPILPNLLAPGVDLFDPA